MRVVIAGGHGKIALRLTRMLADAGHEPIGLVRNPEHVADVAAVGGAAVELDLESATQHEVGAVVDGADAAVFAAGAGPGSGVARKDTVDHGAATLLAGAAEAVGVRRHVQISAINLDRADDPSVGAVFQAYLRAKAAAEQDLRVRDLDWTIVRPGRLTDDPGTGRVQLAASVERAEIPRADVAAVLAAVLPADNTYGRTLELVSGATPVADAVAAIGR